MQLEKCGAISCNCFMMNKQDFDPTNNLTCPQCVLSHIKENEYTHYGKQNHQCLSYGRQFLIRRHTVSDEKSNLSINHCWNEWHYEGFVGCRTFHAVGCRIKSKRLLGNCC